MKHTGRTDLVVCKAYQKTNSRDPEPIDAEVVAVLVNKRSDIGCVRVLGHTVRNTITSPDNIDQRLLVFIDGKDGDRGWFYGYPQVILFRLVERVKQPSVPHLTSQRAVKVEIPEHEDVRSWVV